LSIAQAKKEATDFRRIYVILGNDVDDGQRPKHKSLLLQYIIASTGIVRVL